MHLSLILISAIVMASSVNGYVLSPIKHMVKQREIKNDAQNSGNAIKVDNHLLTNKTESRVGYSKFRIQSRFHKKVLQVTDTGFDVKLVDLDNKEPKQIWYMDETKILRSNWNKFCFNSESRYSGRSNLQPCAEPNNQTWTLKDNHIINVLDPSRCMEPRLKGEESGIADSVCHNETHGMWEQCIGIYELNLDPTISVPTFCGFSDDFNFQVSYQVIKKS